MGNEPGEVDFEPRLDLVEPRLVDEATQGVPTRWDRPNCDGEIEPVDPPNPRRDFGPHPGERLVEEREVKGPPVVGDNCVGALEEVEEVGEDRRRVPAVARNRITQIVADNSGRQVVGESDEPVEWRSRGRPRGIRPEADGADLEDRPLTLWALLGITEHGLEVDCNEPSEPARWRSLGIAARRLRDP